MKDGLPFVATNFRPNEISDQVSCLQGIKKKAPSWFRTAQAVQIYKLFGTLTHRGEIIFKNLKEYYWKRKIQ